MSGRAAVADPCSAPPPVDGRTWRGRALAPGRVYGAFLAAIVNSLGAPLIPHLADVYSVSLANAQWSLTITFLTGTVLLPVLGYLGDGPRRLGVLRASLLVLTAGSVLAALPADFATFLLGRAMQGVGLALVPLTMSVARDHLDARQARATVAMLSVTVTVGLALGYPATGLLSEYVNFRAAFWLAAGLTVVAIVLCQLVVPGSSHRALAAFDPLGMVLLSLGIAGVVVCASEGEDWGWSSVRWLAAAGASLAVLAAWAWFGRAASNPIVDLRQLRNRVVLSADVAAFLMGIGIYVFMSMAIRFLQTPTRVGYGLGESITVSGFALVPISIAGFYSNKIVTRLSERRAPGRLLPPSTMIFTAAIVMFAFARSQLWEILIEMALIGLAVGGSFAALPRMIVSAVPPDVTARALSLNQVLKTLGQTIGSGLSATILSAYTIGRTGLPTNSGYTIGALITCGLFAAASVASLLLNRSGGARPLDDADELLAAETGAGQGQLAT